MYIVVQLYNNIDMPFEERSIVDTLHNSSLDLSSLGRSLANHCLYIYVQTVIR